MIIKVNRPESGLSVVFKETFLYQFDVFTEGLFRDFEQWPNCVVAGGAVLGLLFQELSDTLQRHYCQHPPI
jgi:hypothetical protein